MFNLAAQAGKFFSRALPSLGSAASSLFKGAKSFGPSLLKGAKSIGPTIAKGLKALGPHVNRLSSGIGQGINVANKALTGLDIAKQVGLLPSGESKLERQVRSGVGRAGGFKKNVDVASGKIGSGAKFFNSRVNPMMGGGFTSF